MTNGEETLPATSNLTTGALTGRADGRREGSKMGGFRSLARMTSAGLASLVAGGVFVGCFARSAEANAGETKEGSKAVAGLRRFGFELAARLAARPQRGNVFVSPLSVGQALALAANGAGGRTRTALLRTLRLDGADLAAVNAENARLLATLTKPPTQDGYGVQMVVANAVWADRSMRLTPGFVEAARRSYRAEAASLDFGVPRAAAGKINGWANNKTKGRIPKILEPAILTGPPPARLVLTNAVYFKGRWSAEFWKEDTQPAPFRLAGGAVKRVPTMRRLRAESFPYREGAGYTAARLGYKGRAGMYVFLPTKGTDPVALVRRLADDPWLGFPDSGWNHDVEMDLYLPRFRTGFDAELLPALKGMGLSAATAPDAADLTPMGLAKGDFFSNVLHKTFLDVNEEGTEAAAVTAMVGVVGAAAPQPRPKKRVVFRVDRPFVLVILDEEHRAPLFVGVINDPTR